MYFGRWDDKKGCVYALLKKAFKSVFVQDYSKESSSYKTFSVFGPNIAKYKGETIFWIRMLSQRRIDCISLLHQAWIEVVKYEMFTQYIFEYN